MIRRHSFWQRVVGIVTVALLVIVPTIGSGANTKSEWRLGGQNLKNTRYQATEQYLSPVNVAKLSPKWVLTTGGNISATPAVLDGTLYVPDEGGNFFKIDAQKGTQIWSKSIAADYVKEPNIPTTFSRTSPLFPATTAARRIAPIQMDRIMISAKLQCSLLLKILENHVT